MGKILHSYNTIYVHKTCRNGEAICNIGDVCRTDAAVEIAVYYS